MQFTIQGPLYGVAARCEPILRALPDWFGVDSAVSDYVRTIDTMPTFLACDGDDTGGFVTVKQQGPQSAEMYVLGVRCELHRRGIGRALLQAAEKWLADGGTEYAYIKTLGGACNCDPWGRTRLFYSAMGYRQLQEFYSIWPGQACSLMVKRL